MFISEYTWTKTEYTLTLIDEDMWPKIKLLMFAKNKFKFIYLFYEKVN